MTWSAVAYIPYNSDTECVFAINGTNRKRFEGLYSYEWGTDAPVVPPVLTTGSGTGLTGNYNAVYTYARKERDVLVYESNASPEASSVAALSNKTLVIEATPSADEQINCIRFYRTAAAGATYYHTADLNYCNRNYAVTQPWEETDQYLIGKAYQFCVENETYGSYDTHSWEAFGSSFGFDDAQLRITSIADNLYYVASAWTDAPKYEDGAADATLSVEVESGHDRPPVGGSVFGPTNNGILFICVGHRLHFCKPQQPEYWPADYYIDVSIPQYPLIGGCFYSQHPYVFDQRTCYLIAGTGALVSSRIDYQPYNLSAQTGAQSASGILAVEGEGIFHTGLDGVYVLLPGSDAIVSKDMLVTMPLNPLFNGDGMNGMESASDMSTAWMLWYGSALYVGYPGPSDLNPSNVAVFDTSTKRWGYLKFPSQFTHAITDKWNNRILAVTATGELWVLENPDVTNDEGTSIAWEVETKEFTLQTRRHFPRWTKYDVAASDAVSAVAYNLLGGEVVQEHTLATDRDPRRRLITLCNGTRFSVRIAGEGPVEIYAVESE